jgi:hypothetical protein
MKAVFALIVIYVGTFLVAIQGASNTPVEASEQSGQKAASGSIDPGKAADIRSLLELVGAKDSIDDAARYAAAQYRENVIETQANHERAQALVNDYLAAFQKRFDADAVNGQLVRIYDRHFTEEEIKGLLEFYGSPLGQKVASELPKIGREVQLAARNASTQAARQAWLDLRAQYAKGVENSRPFPNRPKANRRSPNGQSADQQISADASQP